MPNETSAQHEPQSKPVTSIQALSSCLHDKIEDQNDKTSVSAQLKTFDGSQQLSSQQVIWEEDYEKLMGIFKSLESPPVLAQDSFTKIGNQLPEYKAADLLLKSDKPLFGTAKDKKMVQEYCSTVCGMDVGGLEKFLMQTERGNFIVYEMENGKYQLQPIESCPLQSEFFKKRSIFLEGLTKKCQSQPKQNSLSQFSRQILFLYNQYRQLKSKAIKMIREQKDSRFSQGHDADKEIRKMLLQLKSYRKKRGKK